MGREWQCDFYFGYGFDVIEENALNEKSCIQVLRILITKANNEILELEEDLVTLQSQLAWTDESWSEICSASLREKINCLDISIQSLKNTNVQDEHDFGGCLLLHREPAERMHEIVKAMLEKYFHQKDEQIAPFDPTKKKKKEEVVIQDPANDAVDNLSEKTESLSVSDGLESTFSGLKKKKKKSIILERMKEKESSCNHSFHGKGMTEIINMKSFWIVCSIFCERIIRSLLET